MRRLFVAFVAALLALSLGVMPVATAQDATPTTDLSAYPEVAVTITDTEVQVASDQIPAGYIRLAVTNESQFDNGAGLIAIPEGQPLDELLQATPEAGNFLAPFFYTVGIAGGPTAIPTGETWEQVVYVEPGEWVVFAVNDQQTATVTVAESEDSVTEAPGADVTITETNFAFTGFEQLTAGNQVMEVVNTSDQPHMLDFFQVPDGTTLDDVVAAISASEVATPEPGGLQESDITLVPAGQVLLQSQDTTVWMNVDLAEGTYVMVCFVIDPETGMPHAMEGMVSLFEVGGSGTEGATPAS